jgi:hypothetical protein
MKILLSPLVALWLCFLSRHHSSALCLSRGATYDNDLWTTTAHGALCMFFFLSVSAFPRRLYSSKGFTLHIRPGKVDSLILLLRLSLELR